MKGTLQILFALALFASLALVATSEWKHGMNTVHAQSGCSNAILTGNYGISWQGFDIPKGVTNSVPWAGVGVLTADGTGNMTISFTSALNGKISTGATGAGTYKVSPDCTGSASFTSGGAAGETSNFVIVGEGAEILSVSTLNTQTIVLDAKRQ